MMKLKKKNNLRGRTEGIKEGFIAIWSTMLLTWSNRYRQHKQTEILSISRIGYYGMLRNIQKDFIHNQDSFAHKKMQ